MREKIKLPKNPVLKDHIFLGWYTDNETFNYKWDFKVVPEKNMTLHAKWDIRCDNEQHTFTEWEETSPATCTEAAIDMEKCAVCGVLGTNTKAGHHALGHSAGEASGAIEATCTTDGYTGTGTCIRCSTPLYGEVIPKWDHEYHDWTAPTCTTPGNSQRECINDCGAIDTRTTGYAALGHEGTIQPFAATCTSPGNSDLSGNCVRFAQCSQVVMGMVTPAFGHTGSIPVFAATCTTAGNSESSGDCVRFAQCGHYVTGTPTPALGHQGITPPFAATCTTEGNSAALSGNCVRFAQCGHVVTGTVIPALGHNWIYTVTNTSYPATSTGANCTRCSAPAEPLTRLTQIGDTGPAGGIIFYIAPAGGFTVQGYGSVGNPGYFAAYTAYYLEAAPENAYASTMWWSNTDVLIPNLSQSSSDTTDRAIGRGRLNTALIIAAHSADTIANNAAKAAAAYSGGGKDDWFLPSREELNEIYLHRSHVGITSGFFWSSSQGFDSTAWDQNFANGSQGYGLKNNNRIVRAIRAF